MNLPREPKLTTIPNPPKQFGDDGGHFYRYYDALADELDDDMVKSLKSQLDGILIFAGLFAGVNSAFLALTLPEMSADPADDTNALLLQLVTQPGGNGTIRSAEDLPSATFTPSPGVFPVNVLFCLSLTLALLSAFLAVLGQQWLVYYRKRSGGGPDSQRWEQLRRYLGARRWRLEAILDDVLPGLLQLALVIFCIGFVAYLRTLSKTMCYVIMGPMTTAGAVLLLMGVVGAWDRWCPFKSPLSHLVQVLGNLIKWHSIAAKGLASNVKMLLAHFLQNRAQRSPTFLPSWKVVWGTIVRVAKEAWGTVVNRALDRSGESIAQLEAVAAKRVLCISEDFNALIYTAVNLHGMTSNESIQYFLGDETVYERLKELWEDGRHHTGLPKVLAGAFSRAFIQLVFMGESAELLLEPRYRRHYSEALSPSGRDPASLDFLKQNVKILDECIFMGVELLHIHWNDSIWLLYYCQILSVILDKDCGSGQIEIWLRGIIAKYSIPDDCKPHIIRLIAWGVRLLNRGVVTPTQALTRGVSDKKQEFEWVRERVKRVEWVRERAERVHERAERATVAATAVQRAVEAQEAWKEEKAREAREAASAASSAEASKVAAAAAAVAAAAAAAAWRAAGWDAWRERQAARKGALAAQAMVMAVEGVLKRLEGLEGLERQLKQLEQLKGLKWLERLERLEELEQLEQRLEGLRQRPQQRLDPEPLLRAQRQQAIAVKQLVGSVGWEKPLVPEGGLEYPQDTVLGLIEEAFETYTSQSPRSRNYLDVWLLEQALVISTKNRDRGGWEFVVTSSVDLICSLHEVEDPDTGRHDWHNEGDCLRSTKILSQCLQAMKEYFDTPSYLRTIQPVLTDLEKYLLKFTTDLQDSRCAISVLSVWGEIREMIEPTAEWDLDWRGRKCRDSYLRVEHHFDTIESALRIGKVAPKTDGNPADLSPIPAADREAGPSGSRGTAVTGDVGRNDGEPELARRMREDTSGCREDQNALVACLVDSPIEECGGGDPRDYRGTSDM